MASDDHRPLRIALEGRLRGCPQIKTLGVRPNFGDYSDREQHLIREAKRIYYPSAFYASLFDAMGKETFPRYHTYCYSQDKIRQSALFELAGIPHPRTRVFYGKRQKSTILDHFELPVVAKKPRGSAMGRDVALIRDPSQLKAYCQNDWPAYIQEYLPVERDIRVVVIGGKVRHAYWRYAADGDFRTNVSAGGTVSLDPVPRNALQLAERTARQCRWDDVGLDILCHLGAYYVVEANMKYGLTGFKAAGIDFFDMMGQLIRAGEI